jgi:hypothetical protein
MQATVLAIFKFMPMLGYATRSFRLSVQHVAAISVRKKVIICSNCHRQYEPNQLAKTIHMLLLKVTIGYICGLFTSRLKAGAGSRNLGSGSLRESGAQKGSWATPV